ncbi:MAG: hypothetical protein QOH78_1286 [Verrucomicrobiota bacterium]
MSRASPKVSPPISALHVDEISGKEEGEVNHRFH